MKTLLIAGMLLGALSAQAYAGDSFGVGSGFKLALDHVTIKNQTVLMGKDERTFTYGDTCRTLEHGDFTIVERELGFVIIVYKTVDLDDLAPDECPTGSIVVFQLKNLADEIRLAEYRKEEEKLSIQFRDSLKK